MCFTGERSETWTKVVFPIALSSRLIQKLQIGVFTTKTEALSHICSLDSSSHKYFLLLEDGFYELYSSQMEHKHILYCLEVVKVICIFFIWYLLDSQKYHCEIDHIVFGISNVFRISDPLFIAYSAYTIDFQCAVVFQERYRVLLHRTADLIKMFCTACLQMIQKCVQTQANTGSKSVFISVFFIMMQRTQI